MSRDCFDRMCGEVECRTCVGPDEREEYYEWEADRLAPPEDEGIVHHLAKETSEEYIPGWISIEDCPKHGEYEESGFGCPHCEQEREE